MDFRENQKNLRLYNKMRKLFEREEPEPLQALTAMLILCADSAIDEGLSLMDFVMMMGGSIEHFVEVNKIPSFRKELIMSYNDLSRRLEIEWKKESNNS